MSDELNSSPALEPAGPAIPQPEDIPSRDKEDAMGGYLMMFGALHFGLPIPFLSLIASWIYHAINHKKSAFTGFHSHQALMSQIPISILTAVWIVWGIMILIDTAKGETGQDLTLFWAFSIFTLALFLIYVVYCIIGAVKARKGQLFYFPIFGVIAFHKYFTQGLKPAKVLRNEPPKGF